MKAVLDHVGIAVADLEAALSFFRDALGLHVEPPGIASWMRYLDGERPVAGSPLFTPRRPKESCWSSLNS